MTTKDNSQESNHLANESTNFDGHIVGIGASAGGLEALEHFFTACPEDSGLAFVVVQHLSPDYKSMMGELLSRYTSMPINVVENGMELKANNVFLIPSGTLMRIKNGKFKLTDKEPHTLTLPVDIFFNSMAESYGAKAVGVVLSGTGSDGTRGAYAINAEDGFILAQEPGSAKFNGMPNSVIATGLVDDVLPADKLAKRILKHAKSSQDGPAVSLAKLSKEELPDDYESALELIFKLLTEAGGVDFRDYKAATVGRRIERRMQVRRISDIEDYAVLLTQDHSELASLRRELLIPVTSFFRDPQAFDDLQTHAIEAIVKKTDPGETIRVWCAGVATGEEPYSIAISFMATFEKLKKWPTLKIFSTDANQTVLDIAAAGQYPESIAAEIKPSYLERFFKKMNGIYTVKQEVRQCIVFAKHNLISDPPFTKMDLVSCRNTLIYFKNNAQEQAMNRLQYAIKEGGFLFLGSSESLASHSEGFEVLSAKHKIFQRISSDMPLVIDNSTVGKHSLYSMPNRDSGKNLSRTVINHDSTLVDDSTRFLLDSYAPPAILVNSKHEAVHWFGDLQPYFKLRPGNASMEIIKILPDALVSVVAALLYKALKDNDTFYSDFLRVKLNDNSSAMVRVCVQPVLDSNNDNFALVVFENRPSQVSIEAQTDTVDIDEEIASRVRALQHELLATRESLQATIEELETSNEELQATNEELMASNEELQSSNEELQSVNEELNTVNAEYQEKMLHLNQANADLESMGRASGVATVFVDWELNVTRYTPDALTLFKLIPGDIGRPLNDIRNHLKAVDLITLFKQTIDTGRPFEQEVLSEQGLIYLMRILPYNITNSRYPGAIATFTDITALQDKQSLQMILNALPENVAVLSQDGTIEMVNAAWENFAKANGDSKLSHSGVGTNYLEVCAVKEIDTPDSVLSHKAFIGIKSVLEGTESKYSLLYPCHSPTEERWFVMNVSPIIGHNQYRVVVSHSNISAWYQAQTE